jgi:Mg/Co/Ni transporter MgtE
MEKMLQSDIRHLPIVTSGGELKGMISIKDLVKTVVKEKEQTIKVLSDFALGKGGHFGSE